MSSCDIILKVKTPAGSVDSKLFKTLYEDLKIPRKKVIDIYYKARSSEFISRYGNWPLARLSWIKGEYKTIEEAKEAFNIKIETDSLGEPTLDAISSVMEDFGYSKPTTIKPGVQELFESDSNLANQVYEALGFQEKYKGAEKGDLINELKQITDPYLKELADLFIQSNINIPLYYSKGNDYAYVVPDNTLIISKGSVGIIKQKSIIHEVLHGGTSNNLLSNSDFKNRIESIINNIKQSDQQGRITFNYELENADEFISGLADKAFGNYLKQKGVFDEVITILKDNISFEKGFKITSQQKQQALQLYSQYLDSIFPDSKVKDIVYHGITSRLKEKFDKFSKEFIKSGQGRYGEDGFFFSENKEEVNKNYNSSGLITAIINLRNTSKDIYKNTWKETVEYLTEPQEIYGGKTDLDYLSEGYRAAAWNKEGNWKKQIERLKEDGWKIEETTNSYIKLGKISSQEKTYYSHLKKNLEKGTLPFNVNNSVEAIRKAKEQGLDGLIYENVLEESSVDKHNQYVVFEPEQIHILGNKQDIEGFKEFVSKPDLVNLESKVITNDLGFEIVSQYPELINYLDKYQAERLSRLINDSYNNKGVKADIVSMPNGQNKVVLATTQGEKLNIDTLSVSPKVDRIIQRLAQKLPGINVVTMTYAEAQARYKNKLPQNSNSMIDGSNVILFSDRVTEETAIEEMLHPFVFAIAKQNTELFNNLLEEAKRLYPSLAKQIARDYKGRGETTVNLEIVTQALSKSVNLEYENNDTRTVEETKNFFRKFLDMLADWFNSIITESEVYISPDMLESSLTLGEVAILLNTEGLQFTQEFTDEIYYNLTANTAYTNQMLDYESRTGEEIPESMHKTLNKLFQDSAFVTYDEGSEQYTDKSGNVYTRISDFIKNFIYKGVVDFFGFDGNEDDYAHNREWGNQIDSIFESVLEGSSEEEAINKWKVNSDFSVAAISEDVARRLFKDFTNLKEKEYSNAIIIPQVVIFNQEKKIAGRADAVAVFEDGTIKVIDLKSSITSTKGFEYAKEYTTAKGPRASKKLRHSAQVSAYKGLFLSQGYEFSNDDLGIIPTYIKGTDENNFADEVELEPEIEVNGIQDVVSSLDVDNTYKGETFADNQEALSTAKSIIDKVLKTLAQRKLTLERSTGVKASSFKKKEIEKLEKMLKDAQYIKSLSKFIDDAYGLFVSKTVGDNKFPGLAYEIRNKIKALRQEKDKLKVIDELNYYRKMVESYMPIMNEIRDFYQREIGFNENVIPGSELDKIQKIVDAQQTVLTVYNKEILPEIANLLAESASQSANVAGSTQYESMVKRRDELLAKGHTKRAAYLTSILNKMEARNVTKEGVTADIILENLREGANEDIPLLDLWLSPAISSSNSVVALFAKKVKEKFENARVKLIKFRSEGIKAFQDFKKIQKGSDNPAEFNKPFYEIISREYTNDKGEKIVKNVAKFVQPYNEQAYINAKAQFKQSVEKLPFQERRSAWRKWYNDNHETLPEEDEVVVNPYNNSPVIIQKGRKTLILEALEKVENGVWTKFDYDVWLRSNMIKKEDGSVEFKNEFTRPSRRVFPNAKYTSIQNNPAQKKYYDYLIASYFNAQERTPVNSRLGYTLPSISKNANDRLREQGLLTTVKREASRTIKVVEEDVDMFGESIEGEKVVPLLFHQTMDASNVSLDLISSVLRFEDATLKFEAQSSLAGLGDATLQTLKENVPFKKDSLGNKYLDEAAEKAGIKDSFLRFKKKHNGNNVAALFEAFLEMQIYGQMNVPHPLLFNLDANKLANSLMGFTSKIQIGGLNIVGNVANSMINHVSVNIEAAGKQWFTEKELAWAKYTFNRETGTLLKDFTEPENKSFLGQIVDLYDPMQGEFRDKYGRKVSHSVFKKLWSQDSWFFLMHQTDYSIQVQVLLAHLKKTKVKRIVNGKTEEISLIDAYEMGNNGKIKLKEGVELEGRTDESGILDFDTMNKVHAINKRMFGIYNKFDEVNLSRYWYGRLLIMYKKHVAPGFKRRFKGVSRDEELGDITEGFHSTFLRLALTQTKDMVKALYSSDSNLTPLDKANLKKSVRDMMWVMATGILVMVLANLYADADDDEKGVYKYALFFALRLNQDLGVYGTFGDPQNLGLPNLKETLKLVKNPVVSLSVIERGLNVVSQLKDPFEKREQGSGIFEKGDSKLGAALFKFGGISGTNFDPENAIKYMQQNK